ncbi:MAG: Sec-independent protein translocase protein TatB [Xanthomonadaceae bacterium]|nr:Sec-independent protein translocase protein TatB [Xanthomonadaceae bacterium]
MGGIGFTEMVLLAVIALIVIGPDKLPKIARAAGQLSRQARNAWQGLQTQLQAELDAEHNREIMNAMNSPIDVDEKKTDAIAAAGADTAAGSSNSAKATSETPAKAASETPAKAASETNEPSSPANS